MILGYFDENDGVAQPEVRVGGTSLAAWNFNQNLASPGPSAQSLVRTTVTRGYRSTRGEDRDRRNTQPEPARVDYIEFVPVSVAPLGGAGSENNTLNWRHRQHPRWG